MRPGYLSGGEFFMLTSCAVPAVSALQFPSGFKTRPGYQSGARPRPIVYFLTGRTRERGFSFVPYV